MPISSKKIYIFNLFCKIAPPSRCNKIKIFLLRWAGAKVGNNVSLFSPRVLGNFELIIGDNCWIGHESMLMGPAGSKIEMKKGSKLGTRAILVTGYHDSHISGECVGGDGLYGDIVLERGCGVDTMSMVCPGKTIGTRAHVTACSIVRHNVPPYSMVMGSPAKVVGFKYPPEEVKEYEEETFPLEERHSIELLERNYRKYFINRIKEIRTFVKL